MRIIKTSQEKTEENERRQKAYLQAMECPECGEKTLFLNRVPLLLSGTARHVYHCECKKCGCEWETDEW